MMIDWIVKAALGPLLSLGEKYLESQTDKERLKAGVEQTALEAESRWRVASLSSWAFTTAYGVLYISHAIYAASIVLDSYSAIHGLAPWGKPLQLPLWYQEMFGWVMLGLTGMGPLIIKRR